MTLGMHPFNFICQMFNLSMRKIIGFVTSFSFKKCWFLSKKKLVGDKNTDIIRLSSSRVKKIVGLPKKKKN